MSISITDLSQLQAIANDYNSARQFFFKELTGLLSKAIRNSGYTIDKPLDALLSVLNDFDLCLYAWKNDYLKAHVFDREDQRRELMKSLNFALAIATDTKLKKLYITNHDEECKNYYNRTECYVTETYKDQSDLMRKLLKSEVNYCGSNQFYKI